MGSKNMAVVRVIDTDEIMIESVFQLEGYNRSWLTSKNSWPEQATLFDQEGIQDRYCQILLIGTKLDCELYEKSLHQPVAPNQPVDGMLYVYKEQYDELFTLYTDLKKEVYHLRQEVLELKNATCVNVYDQGKNKVHLVGEYKVPVPVYRVVESSLIGFNASGFLHFVEGMLGNHIFYGKNWKAIDSEDQTKIQDLLRHFVLNNYMREENKPPAKPSVLSAKYKEIYDSFINMLNSRKYANKRKSMLPEPEKKRKKDPFKEEHNNTSSGSSNAHGDYNQSDIDQIHHDAEVAAQNAAVDEMNVDSSMFY